MFTTFVLLLTSVVSVHGHGYLQTPRSRNYVASVDGKGTWNGGPTDPAIEYDAQSLNVVGKKRNSSLTIVFFYPNPSTHYYLPAFHYKNHDRTSVWPGWFQKL